MQWPPLLIVFDDTFDTLQRLLSVNRDAGCDVNLVNNMNKLPLYLAIESRAKNQVRFTDSCNQRANNEHCIPPHGSDYIALYIVERQLVLFQSALAVAQEDLGVFIIYTAMNWKLDRSYWF